LADHLLEGCHLHGETIGLKQNDEATMRAAIATASAAELQAGRALTRRAKAYKTLDAGDVAGRATLYDCKLRLAQKIGQRWSSPWEATGFPDRSTAVPRTMDPRYVLLDSLKRYFTANPDLESTDHGATAALCEAAWKVNRNARLAVNLAESAMTAACRARRAAIKALRKRCRGLVVELWVLLPRDDARWKSFGLKIPAARAETPAAEEGGDRQE
jgi:hypothetical protein